MNDLTPRPPEPDPGLMAMTAAQRLQLALSLVDDMAANFVRLSQVVYAARACGDDIGPFRRRFGGLLVLMLQVGCGQVYAGTYLRFGSRADLYRPIGRLDLAEQKRLAEGGTVPVVVPNPASGEHDLRERDPFDLSDEEIRLVFGHGELRTEAQQRAMLDRAARATIVKARIETVGRIKIDKARGGIVLHGFATAADVKRALRLLEGG